MSKGRASGPLAGVGVLVVEDDFIICMGIESVLVEAGAKVLGNCQSLREALDFIASKLPGDGQRTVGILDVRLGDETSFPAARALSDRRIPFLFYSGQASMAEIREEWPDCRVISKPAFPAELVDAGAALASAHRS